MSRVVGGIVLSKKEAAEYLGVSPRTLERYVRDSKLSVRYEDSANGEVALFDPDELARLVEEKQIPRIKSASEGLELAPITSDIALSRGVGGFLAPLQELAERLILALSDRDERKTRVTSDKLRGKLLLTLPEAQILTGLSREILMEAIKDGRLPSQIMGKAYRIKVKDLERFIDELW
jgi:excisionase family DNA binding protein